MAKRHGLIEAANFTRLFTVLTALSVAKRHGLIEAVIHSRRCNDLKRLSVAKRHGLIEARRSSKIKPGSKCYPWQNATASLKPDC